MPAVIRTMVGIAQYFAAQRDNVRTGTHDSAAICVQLTRSNVSNHLACLRDCESGSTGDASVGLLRGDPKLPGYTAPRPGTARLAVPGRGRRGHADTGRTRRHGHLRPTHSPGRRAPPDAVALSAHHDGGYSPAVSPTCATGTSRQQQSGWRSQACTIMPR